MARKLPRGVQRRRNSDGTYSYRAWVVVGGSRVYGARTDDLDAAAAEAMVMRGGQWKAKEALTIRQAMELVLEQARLTTRPATLGWYQQEYALLRTIWRPDQPLSRISPVGLQRFIRKRIEHDRVSPTTLQKQRAALNRLFVVATKNGWRGDNPVQQVEWPKVRRPRKDVFRPAEIEAILGKVRAGADGAVRCSVCDAVTSYPGGLARHRLRYLPHRDGRPRMLRKTCPVVAPRKRNPCGGRLVVEAHGHPGSEPDADMMAVLFYTGLRRSELARLRVRDVDLDGQRLFVSGKTGDVELPLKAEAAAVLRRMIGRAGDRVHLVDGRAEAQRRDGVARAFSRWKERLGEPRLHPHAMRHSFVTALIDQGVDIGVVQRLSRHRTAQMLLEYVQASGPASRAALDALPGLGDGDHGETSDSTT